MYRLLGIILLCLAGIPAGAQSLRPKVGLAAPAGTQSAVPRHTSERTSVRPTGKPDTVYSCDFYRRYGWYEPGVVITPAVAALRSSFRFTNRDAEGHWRKVESLVMGTPGCGAISPYIVKLGAIESDTLVNSSWKDRLKSTSYVELASTPDGRDFMQERAYDAEGGLVYTFSRTPLPRVAGEAARYVGSYRDANGLAAEMRRDITGLYTYGTLVSITEDCWGTDSLIEFMDARGLKKANSEGVAAERYIRNPKGQVLQQQSCDISGRRTIDNWGNCGVQYSYNEAGLTETAMFMDARWRPMAMPDFREVENHVGVVSSRFTYNYLSLVTSESFYDEYGKPMTNKYGIHRIENTMDSIGTHLQTAFYGLDGQLATDKNGNAVTRYTYDGQNRLLSIDWLDSQLNPNSTPGYLCRREWHYDDSAEAEEVISYLISNGERIVDMKEYTSPTLKRQTYRDGTYEETLYDSRGRELAERVFYGDTTQYDHGVRTRYRYIYEDWPDGSRVTKKYGDGMTAVWTTDSVTRLKHRVTYGADGTVSSRGLDKYRPGFEKTEYNFNMGRQGTKARVEDLRYNYCTVYPESQVAGSTGHIHIDEFGEPDYGYYTDTKPFYYCCYRKIYSGWFDEDSREITDPRVLSNRLPKVWSIEVTDTAAYALGLRDGDVIVADGSYGTGLLTQYSYVNFRCDRYIRRILNAGRERRMIVFRVNPDTREYWLVEIPSLKGTPGQLGYIERLRYLTRRQRERILSSINEGIDSDSISITRDDVYNEVVPTGDHALLVSYRQGDRNKNVEVDPRLILGVAIPEMGRYRLVSSTSDTKLVHKWINDKERPRARVFMTADCKAVENAEFGSGEGVWTIRCTVDDTTWQSISPAYDRASALLDSMWRAQPQFKPRRLAGYWTTVGTMDNINVEIDRKGNLQGFAELNSYVGAGDAPDKTVHVRGTAGLTGALDEQGIMAIECSDSKFERRADGVLLSREIGDDITESFLHKHVPATCIIESVDGKTMTLLINGDRRVYLHKTKKPCVRPTQAADAVKPSADAKVK